jgi:predicted permease
VNDFIFIFLVICIGFIVGQILGRFWPALTVLVRQVSVSIALRICIPTSILVAIWQLPVLSWNAAALPVVGTLFLLSGFVVGFVLSKLFKLAPIQQAVFAPAAGFTNIGAVGALVVLVYLGESGLALLPLFKLFEEFVYFALFFPYAAKFSPMKQVQHRVWWKDRVLQTMMLALIIGLFLNLSSVTRPQWMGSLSGFLVPLGTFSLMISVGLVFRFGSMLKYWREAAALALAKQFLLPLVVIGLVLLTGQVSAYDGLFLKVSVLIAMMPMAFIVLLPAAMYQLDQDLANACWLVNLILFLMVVPFMPWLLSLI